PVQPRVRAPRARVRNAQDHLARGGDQARAGRRAASGQPRRRTRLGFREGLRRGDVADAPAGGSRGLRGRDGRGPLRARVLSDRLRRGRAERLRAVREERPGVRPARRDRPPDRQPGQGRARARVEAAHLVRAADPPDDPLGPGVARPALSPTRLTSVSVPLFETSPSLAPLRDQLRDAVGRVLDSGRYILGPEVQAFEGEFADYCGAEYAVGVANGTDAITIALRAMGVGPGDEVVVPSFTFYASVEAIPATGARPVFCDIDPDTYCVTVETVRAALTARTKAVIAVDLFGNLAPVADIQALGVPVLEAAAQAAGSRMTGPRARAQGLATTSSFYPPKNLACFGDGGMIVSSDEGVAERSRTLRFHGSRDKLTYEHVGYNSRLDELQAAILRVQLPHLDGRAAGRFQAGRHYQPAGLRGLGGVARPGGRADPA